MREHVIYYFSGTGNSLKTALSIQKTLRNCDVISMGSEPGVPGKVLSIGFVFPSYYGGVPRRVLQFIAKLDASGHENTYVYAVVTFGSVAGSVLRELERALQGRGLSLAYSANLKAFANYVVLYDMSNKVAEKTAQTKVDLQPILVAIAQQQRTKEKEPSLLARLYSYLSKRDMSKMDEKFVVRASCTSCGRCVKVCPVHNIKLEIGVPHWLGKCEQCMACIQWCPECAIDYGEKTRRRGRYTNSEITAGMFIDYANGAGNISSKE